MKTINLRCREQQFDCRSGQTILQALSTSEDNMLRVGCRSGGCGICRIKIVSGRFRCDRMSKAHVSDTDLEQGITLACKTFALTDLEFISLGEPPQKMRKVLGGLCELHENTTSKERQKINDDEKKNA